MTKPSSLTDEDRVNLVAYLDGELDEESAQALEAKLNVDPQARAELEALKRTWGLLDYLPRAQPSAGFTHRTLQRVAPLRTSKVVMAGGGRWRPWAVGLGWAAAVLLAGAGGFAGVSLFGPKDDVPEDLVRDLRVIENKRLYERVDDIEFLRQLDHPDLFGDDNLGS